MDSAYFAPGTSLNLLLRGGTVLLLALLAAFVWRGTPRSAATRLGSAFALGVAAATLVSAPGYAHWSLPLRVPIAAAAAGNMFVFWLFTRALLDDGFRPRAWHAGVWFASAAAGVASCVGIAPPDSPWSTALTWLMGVSPPLWALLAVLQSLASWREDLVEGRRRLRGSIVVTTAAYTIAQWLAAWLGGVPLRVVIESPANAAGTAALAAFFGWQLLQWRGHALFGEAAQRTPPAAAATAATPPPATARADSSDDARADARADTPADTPDPRQVATLERLMTQQRVYREPSLTVAALAARMGLPEHRLRRLINQGLGHRHFSAFLNGYRIADAQRALRDPALAEVPVLTIAMDAGFQSIGPFNRAFKAATGLTPTEYRRLPSTADAAFAADAEARAVDDPAEDTAGLPELARSIRG